MRAATPTARMDVLRARNVRIERDVVDADEREHGRHKRSTGPPSVPTPSRRQVTQTLGHGSASLPGLCCVARASARLMAGVKPGLSRTASRGLRRGAYGPPTNTDIGHETLPRIRGATKRRSDPA